MSGLEILGLAASVIQIAELGGKLSVQLFTFTRKVKSANKSIDALSQELASTGAVLKQLGETLTKDEHVRVCSQEAISTARGLVEDTNAVFTKLQKVVEGDEKSNEKFLKGISFKQRLKFPFLESQIEQVQANLERLKSSLLVILNVLIFAEQLRNQEALPILKDQRELIKILASEKDENEKRYQRILAAIADKPYEGGTKKPSDPAVSPDGTVTPTATPLSAVSTIVAPGSKSLADEPTSKEPAKVIVLPNIVLPTALQRHHERIHHHSYLVQNLLTEIASLQYNLDMNTRDRMQNGVLNMHWDEWSMYRLRHGHEHFEKMLNAHPDVSSYWTDRLQDHFSRQLEAAEAVRRRHSRISSVSSITTSPEKRTPATSVERPAKLDDPSINKDHSQTTSDADSSAKMDDFDAEAAFGLAAMAALDRQKASVPRRKPLLSHDELVSDAFTSNHFDQQDPSMSVRDYYRPPRAESIPDSEDNIRISRDPEIVPLDMDADASEFEYVIALYDYQPEVKDPRELTFKAGDKIRVIESVHMYWWRGSCGDESGIFPTNYVGVPASSKNREKPAQEVGGDLHNHSISSVNVVSSQSSDNDSMVSAGSFKPRDPKRNAVSLLVEPDSTTSQNLKTQLHKHSASVDAATVTGQPPEAPASAATSLSQQAQAQSSPLQTPVSTTRRPQESPVSEPYYAKVRIRYISPEVLEWEKLPWLYDPIDKNYLVIKKFMRQPELDQLAQQTQVLRNTRSDKIGGADANNEGDVGSPKLKDTFVVIPAPLYARFNGKLEYESRDAKKGDEKNPLFVKFELEGAKKGLLSKAKKKSTFYISTNVEVSAQQSPNAFSAATPATGVELSIGDSDDEERTFSQPKNQKRIFNKWRKSSNTQYRPLAPLRASSKPDPIGTSSGVLGPNRKDDDRYGLGIGAVVAEAQAASTRMDATYSMPQPAHPGSYSQQQPLSGGLNRVPVVLFNARDYHPQSITNAYAQEQDASKPGPPKIGGRPEDSANFSQPTSYASRANYHFEADSSDEDDYMESEIGANINELSGAAKRLKLLSKAMGDEVEFQNSAIQRISDKTDRVDGQIALNTTRLKRIDGTAPRPPQTLNTIKDMMGSSPSPDPPKVADMTSPTPLTPAEKRARRKALQDEQATLYRSLREDNKVLSERSSDASMEQFIELEERIRKQEERLSQIALEFQRLDDVMVQQEYIGAEEQEDTPVADLKEQIRRAKDGSVLSTKGSLAGQTQTQNQRNTNDEPPSLAPKSPKEEDKASLVSQSRASHHAQMAALEKQKRDASWSYDAVATEVMEQRRKEQRIREDEEAQKQIRKAQQKMQETEKGKQHAVFKVGESGFVSMHLEPATDKKAELDEIDKLILQFSALDEGEYVEQYKSVA